MIFNIRSSLRIILLATTSSLIFCNPTYAASRSVLQAGAQALTSARALSLATKVAAGAALLIANSSQASIAGIWRDGVGLFRKSDSDERYQKLLQQLPEKYKDYRDIAVRKCPSDGFRRCPYQCSFHLTLGKTIFTPCKNMPCGDSTLKEFADMLPATKSTPRKLAIAIKSVGVPVWLQYEYGLYKLAQKALFQNTLLVPTNITGLAARAATLVAGGFLVRQGSDFLAKKIGNYINAKYSNDWDKESAALLVELKKIAQREKEEQEKRASERA